MATTEPTGGLPFKLRTWHPVRSKAIEFTGPLFEMDPSDMVKANMHAMVAEYAKAGEAAVVSAIASAPLKRRTGWTQSHVRGRMVSVRPPGKSWAMTAVVSMNTTGMNKTQAIRTQAAGSAVEKIHHPFRRVTAGLKRAIADLAKGLE